MESSKINTSKNFMPTIRPNFKNTSAQLIRDNIGWISSQSPKML